MSTKVLTQDSKITYTGIFYYTAIISSDSKYK